MKVVVPWVVPAVLLVAWQLAGDFGALSPRMLPTPTAVARAGARLAESGELGRHLGASFGRAATGFLIGGSLGLVLGVLTGVSRAAEAVFDGRCRCSAPSRT